MEEKNEIWKEKVSLLMEIKAMPPFGTHSQLVSPPHHLNDLCREGRSLDPGLWQEPVSPLGTLRNHNVYPCLKKWRALQKSHAHIITWLKIEKPHSSEKKKTTSHTYIYLFNACFLLTTYNSFTFFFLWPSVAVKEINTQKHTNVT